MNLEDIKNNYRNYDDDILIKLATDDINSLRKEVLPILEAELKKRKLSITDKPKYSKEQFENPFAKEKYFYSDEYLDYFKSNNKKSINHINEKKFFINISSLLLLIFSLIVGFVLLNRSIIGARLIVFAIVLLFIIKLVLSKLSIGKIAEIKYDKVILTKYPNGNFGVFKILVLILVAVNGLKKIEIPYKKISKFYQKNVLTDKGYYIEIVEGVSSKKKYRIFLEILTKNERKELIEVISSKIVETKNDV